MKKLLIILAAVAILGVGGAVAQGSTRAPDRIPVAEVTRQLDAFEARLMDQEDAIAACMTVKGFEYIPHLPADWVMERAAELDYARGGSGDVNVDAPVDPNDVILARVTPEQVDAYQTAYWGDETTPGCYDVTYEQVFGVNRARQLDELAAAAEKVDAAMATDPRMINARATYVTCMHGYGLDVTGIDDVYRMVDERREALETTAAKNGILLDQVTGYADYTAFEQAAYDAHDVCVVDYHTVEDPVRAGYVDKFLNQP
ncbi:MAG: hypothetical protein GXP34_14750 [Actinobacteria bacterium]|nr:hypothetical protein [Actinomycetota bacterium]